MTYNIDDNYVPYTLVSISSILKNNKSKSDYTFYILENSLSRYNRAKMFAYVKLKGQNIKFIDVNSTFLDDNAGIFEKKKFKHITDIALARILLPEVLPSEVEKIIYLDGDTLANIDLVELYNTNLDGKSVGMCHDIEIFQNNFKYKKYFKELNPDYCNSGVILMDLVQWRKKNITSKVMNLISKKSSTLIFPDQDALNIVLKNDMKILPDKWNKQTLGVLYVADVSEPCLIHYIGIYKPWKYIDPKNPTSKLYYDYLNTPFFFAFKIKTFAPIYFKKYFYRIKTSPFILNLRILFR